MKIYIRRRDYFTFRKVGSSNLDLLGRSVLEWMEEGLRSDGREVVLDPSDFGEDSDYVVLYPAYPFLTAEKLFSFLEEREGSYRFPGGYVIRRGAEMKEKPCLSVSSLGQGLFSLSDYPACLAVAKRISARMHMKSGAFVEEGAEVSLSARLCEGAVVRGNSKISGTSVIGKNALIEDSKVEDGEVGEGTEVLSSHLKNSRVGKNCTVGPNAYLRAGTEVKDGCRIGDFVELKNARVGNRTKIAHLAYVGDATLGEDVNVGCGAVFVNYDGRKKSQTVVGDGCFIGSNCNLIAPLKISPHAFIAAGTTLTRDLQEDDFCVGRARETVKPGRGHEYYFPRNP